ncbi:MULTISPECIES: hypothetical protein [unclassified Lentimonas]|uniref:hypothetical protein n=1 Tax=unclassified Lentimonas TaxID=2630993 RepID=UPI00132AF834|nr:MULTISPECIES: hypothetical protein [unclassified Lentimonas]CAA6676602.1 Unannotated [Lentimonas sp. CC4]CAA6684735.1 Unannotated [Lentimonas sp. CC6]CAA7075371.1 Unannotated [Lentimonas sp. CC4]CAA7168966.1 Unannotated [Lentimonas sp. CC21]CAA7182220.1 Unannotated [Lentimonas sp. CC8]
MDKFKNLLLPLALIFGAIAVFETGARYGATNMRAHAIASELQLPLGIYITGQSSMDEKNVAQWATIIDNGIAAGSVHRQIWYLNKAAKAQLDKVLTFALTVRGDGAAKRFETIANSDQPKGIDDSRLSEIRNAIDSAKVELIDNAPKTTEAESSEQAETGEVKSDA